MSALVSVFAKAPVYAEIADHELPQSSLYGIVEGHLKNKDDGTNKKLLFIGYDGYRRDCLPIITERDCGAVNRVLDKGSILYTYAGGTAEKPQQTSTAAGWSTILTGKSARDSGVWNNRSVKRDSAETFLTLASRIGYSCAFVSSYPSHFTNTFVRDIKTAAREKLPCRYIRTASDEETKDVSLSLISEGKCDVLFVIFEYPDKAGHRFGFSDEKEGYREACIKADKAAYELILAAETADTADTDRLTVITTDHGGIGRRHGGQTAHERATWAVVSKKADA